MKPVQAAAMSKAKPRVMPSFAWMRTAVAGKAESGVEVATRMASTSDASAPARASASRAAAAPRSEAVSSTAAKCRQPIPVRSRIQASEVSSPFSAASSSLESRCAGRYPPHPAMVARRTMREANP